jgi:1,2-dihydroxy-3-keto-5-methylthiopentene dioxygenase
MTLLREYESDADPRAFVDHTRIEDITAAAARSGVRFERWEAAVPLPPGATQEDILSAYRESVDRLSRAAGFASADVVRVHPETPNHPDLRKKFLDEHTHAEDEARFFVEGSGLFTIHQGRRLIAVLCEAGDLINVPAGTPHWFDMGPLPRFTCIRLFTSPAGWVASFTGSDVAGRFPRMGEGTLAV